MAFVGFNIQYPEYEIITPQTKYSYTVRSLTVSEEEKLRSSYLTANRVQDHLNRCIFNTLVQKPEHIATYEDFLLNTTIHDRDALLYGIYHISYGEVRNYEIECLNCDDKQKVNINISDIFAVEMYPGDNVVQKRLKIELPKSKGVFVYIKQPTLKDEMRIVASLGKRPGVNAEILPEIGIIDKFEQEFEDGSMTTYEDLSDIYDAYTSLLAMDRREIYDRYAEEFGKYSISLVFKSVCQKCGNVDEHNISLSQSFFRALSGL